MLFPPTSHLSTSNNSYELGTVRDTACFLQEMWSQATAYFWTVPFWKSKKKASTFCSWCITGQHKTLEGNHYLPSSTYVCSQMPMIVAVIDKGDVTPPTQTKQPVFLPWLPTMGVCGIFGDSSSCSQLVNAFILCHMGTPMLPLFTTTMTS